MKNDSLKVYFKIFVRFFSIFAYFCSAMFIGFILYKSSLPESVSEFIGTAIAIIHLGLLAALWKEFSG